MNRFRAAYDVAWWWLHRWRIGLPLLLVLAGMIGWSSTLTEAYDSRRVYYERRGLEPPPPPLIEKVWTRLGLPVVVHPMDGFVFGHDGFYLPGVFSKGAALGLVWSLLALVSWLMHRRERERALQAYETALLKERYRAPRLSWQLLVGLLRMIAVSCGLVVLYIAAGPLMYILAPYVLVLYFFPLMLYGLGRLAVRGIRGARAKRRMGEAEAPGSSADGSEPGE